MKKIKLIYNPKSGDARFKNKLDTIINRFQAAGYTTVPFRISSDLHIDHAFDDINQDYEIICAAGGDGTVSSVADAMARLDIKLPLGIFPSGTSNDLAAYFGIPKDVKACCDIILQGTIKDIDLGRVNGSHFINVCSAGLLTDIPHKTDTNMKNTLGQMAYYIKGIEEIPKFSPIKMRLVSEDRVIEDNMIMLLILNGGFAGGFTRLAPDASIDDGKMNVIAIKYGNISNMLTLFLKILRGEHMGDPNVYYFSTHKLTIECGQHCETDIDGERGPALPLDVEVMHKFLKVFVP
ncbi:MAG: YegS/Rv2252/BmrU family lipid kinase [Clostridia bacterium]|jgi:YegS/Rv2252/BmrU family lipid kinase|nr:YegS/Rv2252/BmrU family lipid kinase [Clostridia bacterium]